MAREPTQDDGATDAGQTSGGGGTPAAGGQRPGQADKPSMLPALVAPKGGGAIRGIGEKFQAAAATGTASLTVPLPVSPGRNGFGPAVELAYDSGHGNGPFGLGFALSVPSITRKTDKGLPRYYDVEESDEYILSGAEDLVPNRKSDGSLDTLTRVDRVVQRYRPRVEGLFARIERHTMAADGAVHWEVTTKDNVTHTYGRTVATQIADPRDSTRIFTWLLEETRDDKGNFVVYEYKAEDGAGVDPGKTSERSRFAAQGTGAPPEFLATAQRYLKRVRYANFAPGVADDFLFELVFDYGDHLGGDSPTPADDGVWPVRIDPFSSYRSGFEVRTYRLCRRVLMFHRLSAARAPLLVRSTDFFYDPTPAFTYLTSVIQHGYLFDAASPPNVQKSPMPTLALDYLRPVVNDQLSVLPPDSLEGLTGGVDGGKKQWVDLDGEGIPGVLIDEQTAWYYKANGGNGQLAAPRLLRTMPAPAALGSGLQQLQDLGGDGQLDLVSYAEPLVGYASRTADGDFDPFRSFQAVPNVDWRDHELRFIDLDGDGLPDLLITEDQAFIWYRSLAKDGFERARRVPVGSDEQRAPTLAYTDDTQAIQLVDMSGDGLADIVRVRNGEVSYWPNLGYGRFGAKVTLENSPVLAQAEEFDPRRVRFGDVDGTGTSDLVYLGRHEARLYFNQSGNSLSAPTVVTSLPPMDGAARVDLVDILGTGTASLVWSSPLPGLQGRQVMYVDLMAGVKPHLMKSIVNNLGATTQLTYAPSTKFYLEDKVAGIPWLTRLAFPVQVVARVEHIDQVSNSRLTSSYRYRHGFFDGVEREFRGFAYVEHVDAESFTLGPATSEFQPPTRTKTWFHTGAWLERETLEAALAQEYSTSIPDDMLLPDTIIPSGMTIQDEREAMRALRGHMLHQEVYADDAGDPNVGPIKAGLPFSATEQSFEVRLLQTSRGARHGVFFAFSRETIAMRTEREPTDPRVTHDFVMDVDDVGNVTRAATVAYARAVVPPPQPEQGKAWATLHEMDFINHPGDDFYRLGLPFAGREFELTGLSLPAAGQGLINGATLRGIVVALNPANDVPYEGTASGPGVQRRLLDSKRQLYYAEDVNGVPTAAAPLGQAGSHGLPFESYQLALTAGLVTAVGDDAVRLTQGNFDRTTLPAILTSTGSDGGHYVQFLPDDTGYWTRSGRLVFAANQFYLPTSLVDPFGQSSSVVYDPFNLLLTQAQDALGNVVQAVNDYRVLAPSLVTDPNLNRVEVAFDALGMVVKTAVHGKTTESLGDTLDNPTTQMEYDVLRWQTQGTPVVVHTLARETHGASPPPRFQESFAYTDGFGRLVMTKAKAEPGPLFDAAGNQLPGPDANPRWVGTGRTVFNNKGNAVKKYGPFFSATSDFEDEAAVVEAGVTPIIHYDALDRVVRTELPNGTESRVAFDVWTQTASDPNDTVIGTAWWMHRGSPQPTDPEPSDPERRAAWLAARHDTTPTVTHFDALGRPFLVVELNRTYADAGNAFTETPLPTRTVLDVEGNALAIFDPRLAFASPPRPAMLQRFDVLSRSQFTDSADAGQRLTLADVAGKPIRRWDSRTQIFRYKYDELQRPSHLLVRKTVAETSGLPGQVADVTSERLLVRTVYGESLDPAGPAPLVAPGSAAQALNLRGQVYLLYDCAGKIKNDQFDFKANLVSTTRRLSQAFQTEPDWSPIDGVTSPPAVETAADGQLENPPVPAPAVGFNVFTVVSEYDALNRVTRRTAPDLSVTVPAYNQAGLLETLSVAVRAALPPTAVVSNIDYNARGQRLLYEYADPTNASGPVTCRVGYTYDPATFRLTNVVTNRVSNASASPPVSVAKLQDLLYTYDPAGNVVEMDDNADTAPVFSGTTPVRGDGLYRYDSIYRLIHAEGREHPGQLTSTQPRPTFEFPVSTVPHPNDLQALLRYRELYAYDDNNNITRVQHTTAGSPLTSWTRTYNYFADSNRLRDNNDPDATGGTAAYDYTGNGAMKSMSHLPVIDWDYADRMKHANRGPGGGDVYFTYDNGGQRVRKVWLKAGNSIDERIYVGGWETFRQRTGAITTTPTFERETLQVADDKSRIALVETVTAGAGPSGPRWRFQLTNLVASSVMELDAQGHVITYEEYHPYGSTAFQSSGSPEVSAKRYRYTGKEKDEETGLYYHGARYYAPWLGRWTAADPAGFVDGGNLYAYGRCNPLRFNDPTGHQSQDLPPEVRAAWDAAEKAGFDDDSVGRLVKATEAAREGRGQPLLTRQSALEYATIRASAAVSNWHQGNYGRAVIHGTAGVIESFGYAIFGDTPKETARNVVITTAAGAALSKFARWAMGTKPAPYAPPVVTKQLPVEPPAAAPPAAAPPVEAPPAAGPPAAPPVAEPPPVEVPKAPAAAPAPEPEPAAPPQKPAPPVERPLVNVQEGSFSITPEGFKGYPEGIPKPKGPFRLLKGAEYDEARAAANAANRALRKADPAKYAGKAIHEIQPVKYGGSPTDPANKVALTPAEHAKYTTFWNRLQRALER